MGTWKSFECPRCHEAFSYEPSAGVEKKIEEMELKTGRSCLITGNCPHCSIEITLDRETGRTALLDDKSFKHGEMGALMWDMTLKELTWDKADELIERGSYLMRTNLARAEACFRQAIAISKHHPQAWYNLSVCRQESGDLASAVQCLLHALEYDPKMLRAWNNLGSIYALTQMFDEATRCFDQGLAINPNYPKFYLGKSSIAAMQGDYATARRLLHTALEKDPTYEMARAGLRRIDELERGQK